MSAPKLCVRPIEPGDRAQWQPLWDGYNAFYGRQGTAALDAVITEQTWHRFFVESDPVKAFVAVLGQQVVGLVHIVYPPSTSRLNDVCYLQDLFTSEAVRGQGLVKFADADAFSQLQTVPKLALDVRLEPAEGACLLLTRTRVLCPDASSRRRFTPYWYLIRPVSGLIRRRLLGRIRSLAQTAP